MYHTNRFFVFVWQMTGLLQALDEIKGVHLEPRGQGKIDRVLAEYYVSVVSLSGCEHFNVLFWRHEMELRVVLYYRLETLLYFQLPFLLTDNSSSTQTHLPVAFMVCGLRLDLLTLRRVGCSYLRKFSSRLSSTTGGHQGSEGIQGE